MMAIMVQIKANKGSNIFSDMCTRLARYALIHVLLTVTKLWTVGSRNIAYRNAKRATCVSILCVKLLV